MLPGETRSLHQGQKFLLSQNGHAQLLGLAQLGTGGLPGHHVTAIIVLIRRKGWSRWLMILPIILVPGLGVPSYLSYLLHVPYSVLATSLCIGQSVPAVCGVVLVNVLQRALYPKATKA